MARTKLGLRFLIFLALALAAAGANMLFAQDAHADDPQDGTEEYCLSCHGDPDLNLTLPSGELLSLFISTDELHASVHDRVGIECSACHTDITTYPHPEIEYETHRELARSYYLTCRKCHEDNYTETLDSIHAEVAAAGHLEAPICTDCHGAHDIQPPDEPRVHISETCGQCHTDIFTTYRESVHGTALVEEDNQDVPVCTDCHGVHNIQDPRTVQFHIETPELCAGCHADPELMAKYDLSADVYDIYRLSWHGVDVSVYKARWPTIWHDSAVCTDCHGVHDIYPTHDPRSSVHPDTLLATCQKCHPDAGPNWTSAWTGHEEVSLERNAFVFYTQAFYDSFAPLVLWLSGIYVFLQILRVLVARVRRSLQ